jgi:hypothetical protein
LRRSGEADASRRPTLKFIIPMACSDPPEGTGNTQNKKSVNCR